VQNHDRDLKFIKRKATPIAKRNGVDELYLFGSYARDEAGPASDIDFIVYSKKPLGLFKLCKLRYEMKNEFNKDVDIVTKRSLSDSFMKKIQDDVIKIYG
jgi:predicted nucleotidyltransferase